jgi:hypothetical protein
VPLSVLHSAACADLRSCRLCFLIGGVLADQHKEERASILGPADDLHRVVPLRKDCFLPLGVRLHGEGPHLKEILLHLLCRRRRGRRWHRRGRAVGRLGQWAFLFERRRLGCRSGRDKRGIGILGPELGELQFCRTIEAERVIELIHTVQGVVGPFAPGKIVHDALVDAHGLGAFLRDQALEIENAGVVGIAREQGGKIRPYLVDLSPVDHLNQARDVGLSRLGKPHHPRKREQNSNQSKPLHKVLPSALAYWTTDPKSVAEFARSMRTRTYVPGCSPLWGKITTLFASVRPA